MNTKTLNQRAMELIEAMASNDRHLGDADLTAILETLEDEEALKDMGFDTEDLDLVELVDEATNIVSGWIEEGRHMMSHVRTDTQWLIEDLDADAINKTLRSELECPEKFSAFAADELNEGFLTGQMIDIAYCGETGRAGLIHVGSGSSGVSVWTDASSAKDALRRYLTDNIIN